MKITPHPADVSPTHAALDAAITSGDWDRASALASDLYWASRPRMGDIGEPLHVEEGEEEDAPLYVPEIVPSRPEPVPA